MKSVSEFVSLLLIPLIAAMPLSAQSVAGAGATPIELKILHREDATARSAVSIQVVNEAGTPVADATVVFRLTGSTFPGKFADGASTATVQTDADGLARVDGIRGYGAPATAATFQVTATKGATHAGVLFTQILAVATNASAEHDAHLGNSLPPAGGSQIPQRQAATSPVPGVLVDNDRVSKRAGAEDDSLDANVPARHMFGPESGESSAAGVSVVNGRNYSAHEGHSKAKWIIGIAAAAGAGAAFAMLHKGGSSSNSSASGISIGAPSVSVGHP